MIGIKDIPMWIKMGVAPGAALAALISVCLGGVATVREQGEATHTLINTALASEKEMLALSNELQAIDAKLYSLTTKNASGAFNEFDESELSGLPNRISDLIGKVQAYQSRFDPELSDERLNTMIAELQTYRDAVDFLQSMLMLDFNSAVSLVLPFQENMTVILTHMSELVEAAGEDASELTQAMEEELDQAVQEYMQAAMFGAVIVAIITVIMSVLTIASIIGLAKITDRLAEGDMDVDIDARKRRDALGVIVSSLKVFQTSMKRTHELNEHARHTSESQNDVVQALGEGLKRLSDGDLTCQITHPFSKDYEALRADFNAAVSRMEQTISQIKESVHGIGGGLNEISQGSDNLAKRTENNASSIENAVSALTGITDSVQETAQNASTANDAVSVTRTEAEDSKELVQNVVSAMSEIHASSSEISQIIGVMEDIAFQTNLLALNAGVEAARAGDAGKGFAVVASEVRALAARSSESASNIKTLISSSSAQVKDGVDLVAEAGETLDRIATSVVEISNFVKEISSSNTSQAASLKDINSVMSTMEKISQQNAAMVEESTAAVRLLRSESDKLVALVDQFNTSKRIEAKDPVSAPSVLHNRGGGQAAVQRGRVAPAAANENDWLDF